MDPRGLEAGMARILVVDDEPAMRRVLHRALLAEGYDVVVRTALAARR